MRAETSRSRTRESDRLADLVPDLCKRPKFCGNVAPFGCSLWSGRRFLGEYKHVIDEQTHVVKIVDRSRALVMVINEIHAQPEAG